MAFFRSSQEDDPPVFRTVQNTGIPIPKCSIEIVKILMPDLPHFQFVLSMIGTHFALNKNNLETKMTIKVMAKENSLKNH